MDPTLLHGVEPGEAFMLIKRNRHGTAAETVQAGGQKGMEIVPLPCGSGEIRYVDGVLGPAAGLLEIWRGTIKEQTFLLDQVLQEVQGVAAEEGRLAGHPLVPPGEGVLDAVPA